MDDRGDSSAGSPATGLVARAVDVLAWTHVPERRDEQLPRACVEALVEVVADVDVDVLGDAGAAVAEEAGDVFESKC